MAKSKRPAPVFVVSGLSRCGTTLLRLMLTAHSRISIPPESLFIRRLLQHGFDADTVINNSNRQQFMGLVWDGPDTKLVEWQLDKDDIGQRLDAMGEVGLPDAIAEIYWAYARKYHPDAEIWGDKNPSYLWDMEALRTLFPEAKFIVIIRDARDVYLSMFKLGASDSWNFRHFALAWNEVVDIRTRSQDDNVRFVKYEDLLTSPEHELMQLCAFLDVEFEPAMLEYYRTNREKKLVPESRVEWGHRNTLNPVMKNNFNKWARELPRERVEALEYFSREYLLEMGYEPATCAGHYSIRALLLLAINYWRLAKRKCNRFIFSRS